MKGEYIISLYVSVFELHGNLDTRTTSGVSLLWHESENPLTEPLN